MLTNHVLVANSAVVGRISRIIFGVLVFGFNANTGQELLPNRLMVCQGYVSLPNTNV